MKFYVPDPRLDAESDLVLLALEESLAKHGRAFTTRRIRALIWDDGEQEEMIVVGGEYRDCTAGDDPVILILEDAADANLIYVVSLSQAAYEEMPDMVRLDPLWRVVEFDA
jgi:hypothetical protein